MSNQGDEDEQSDDFAFLFEPIDYTLTLPGTEIRRDFIAAFNYWFDVPSDILENIIKIFDFISCSVMLIDDIEDSTSLRSGFPVASKIYSPALTLNASNSALLQALSLMNELNCPGGTEMFTDLMLKHYRGQGIEIWWRESCVCPTEEEYRRMISNKIGSLLTIPIRLMASFSSQLSDCFDQLIQELCFFFQFRADYLNLTCAFHEAGKDFADDIKEGKFTLPIIHAINAKEGDTRVINILKQHTNDVELKSYCVQLMEDFQSLDYARNECVATRDEIRYLVDELGGNELLIKIIDGLFVPIHETAISHDIGTM